MRIPPTGSHAWSLADQAIVSGCNFLTGVLLARMLGPEIFGAYVIAQMYLLYANTFQASLVVSPMMTAVSAQHDRKEQERMLSGFMGCALLVLVITVLGVQAVAFILGNLSPHLGIGSLGLPLACAMTAFQIQDWTRRALYVQLNNRLVVVSDAIAYGGQLLLLAWMGLGGELTVTVGVWSMAATFSLAALFTLGATRIRPDLGATLQTIRTHARASLDFLSTWQLQWLGSQGAILLGSGIVGQQAAGAIRAVQNLLGPVNVLFQWLDNIMPVRASLRLRDHGRAALVAYLGRFAWIGMAALGLFVLCLMAVDEPLIVLLYGEEYAPFAILAVLQALYYLFGYGYRMLSYHHRAIGNTRVLAHASLWWVITALAVMFATIGQLKDRGIMLALVAGQVMALTYLLVPRRAESGRPTAPATRVAQTPFLLLRRGDGSPHLVLPNANAKVMQGALSMYYPSRWLGRLYRWTLARTLPWRAHLGWVETEPSLTPWCPELTPLLAAVPGSDARYVGVLIGSPGPCSKSTLKLLDAEGTALAYARVSRLPVAIKRLRRELAVLSSLATLPAGLHVPRLIAHGHLPDTGGFYLVESAGPEGDTPHVLSRVHFDFLARLVGEDRHLWSDVIAGLEADVAPLHGDPALRGLVQEALATLRQAAADHLPGCIEHGDFTPWNIRDNGEQGIFVLDWEHARRDGLPWLDALHFCFQMQTLVLRNDPARTLRAMRAIFDLPEAAGYAALAPIPMTLRKHMITLYLLRVLLLGHADGHAGASPDQAGRRLVLDLLLTGRAQ